MGVDAWNSLTRYSNRRFVQWTGTDVLGNPQEYVYEWRSPSFGLDPSTDTSGAWIQTPVPVWDSGITYSQRQLVEGSDDNFYECIVASSMGDDPVTNTNNWLQREVHRWNRTTVYSSPGLVKAVDVVDADNPFRC